MRKLILVFLLTAIGVGCAPTPTPIMPTTAEPTATTAPTRTPTVSPTATTTPTPGPTDTPTATPMPTHPLQIEQMRQQEYPGSEIVIEQQLNAGGNHWRYIVSYQSEGNTIFALMTVPFGEKPETGWPVVVFNHGYIPPEIYRTTERYVAYVNGFAANGYIVFRSDYRGHGFSEGEATGGYSSPAYTVDVLNAVSSIARYEDADPNRIGMWGHSMGGHITLRSMVVDDRIKAGVIWGGVVTSYPDMITEWWLPRRPYVLTPTPTPEGSPTPGSTPTPARGGWLRDMFAEYGSPEENPVFWASIGPNAYLEDISGPIQLHHGTNDESVPDNLSRILAAEMEVLDLPVELHTYPGDDHDITTYFTLAMTRSVQFFDDNVKSLSE